MLGAFTEITQFSSPNDWRDVASTTIFILFYNPGNCGSKNLNKSHKFIN